MPCSNPTCTACPHGPYLVARLTSQDRTITRALGARPHTRDFYLALADLLTVEQIRALIRINQERRMR